MVYKIAAVISEEICILHKLQYVNWLHFTLCTPDTLTCICGYSQSGTIVGMYGAAC